jgi:hypothetical protein
MGIDPGVHPSEHRMCLRHEAPAEFVFCRGACEALDPPHRPPLVRREAPAGASGRRGGRAGRRRLHRAGALSDRPGYSW